MLKASENNNAIIKIPQESIEVWQRMFGESAKAYSAFVTYQRLAARERSLRRAVEVHYGSYSSSKVRLFQRWSARFMWVDRAGSWDEYLVEEARQTHRTEIENMEKIHAQTARALLQKALTRLKKMEDLELAPSDVLRYISEAVRIERLSLGEPGEITEDISVENTELSYIEMSDDELRKRIIEIRLNRNGK